MEIPRPANSGDVVPEQNLPNGCHRASLGAFNDYDYTWKAESYRKNPHDIVQTAKPRLFWNKLCLAREFDLH